MRHLDMAEEKKFFTYKGKPLVRKDNTIYFGNMYDDYVVMIEIKSTAKQGKLEVADKVKLRRMATTMPPKIDKTADVTSLYEALDIACAWLNA